VNLSLRLAASFLVLGAGLAHASDETAFRTAPYVLTPAVADAPTLSVLAVGDVLLHTPLHKQALKNPDGHRSLWRKVSGPIVDADISYANLEGPVAHGVDRRGMTVADPGPVFDDRVYTSYPAFNYHDFLVTDLKASGFDVVSTANNHALDRGAKGADLTLAALQAAGLPEAGMRASSTPNPTADDWSVVVESQGFHVAFVACAFGTNGIPDRFHQVANCDTDRAALMDLVSRLSKNPDIDFVVVTPHVGIEYETTPRPVTVNLDRAFIEAGATLVLGAHPHVTQKWESLRAKDGHEGVIVYSLGNFVSGQFQRVLTRASVMTRFELQKQNGKTVVTKAEWLPLEMVSHGGVFEVEPMAPSNPSWPHMQEQFGQGATSP
jgi:poly-gamma-glutamate synthesis protein (capsule biosynthesis protein)